MACHKKKQKKRQITVHWELEDMEMDEENTNKRKKALKLVLNRKAYKMNYATQ